MDQTRLSESTHLNLGKLARYDLLLTSSLLLLLLTLSVFTASWWHENISRMQWLYLDTTLQTIIGALVVSPLLLHPVFEGRRFIWLLITIAAIITLDLGHFVSAGSLSLEAAINLPTRPVSHSFTFVILGGLTAWLISRKWPAALLVGGGLTSHLFHDMFDHGVPFFWPFSDQIITSTTLLFIVSQTSLFLFCAIIVAQSNRSFREQGIFSLMAYLLKEIGSIMNRST
jgi:hypothetical protein